MTKVDLQEEIVKLQKEQEDDEKKLKVKLAQEIKNAQAETKKEIEDESIYRRDCLDIAIAKLRREVEQNIDKLSKERYKDLGAIDELASKAEIKDVAQQTKQMVERDFEKEIEKERQLFEKESRDRQIRFEAHMQRLFSNNYRDDKKIELLKKEVLPIVNAKGLHKIADEAILDRYRVKITRNAIRTGTAWALYNGSYQDKAVLCRVTALIKVPIEIRREQNSSAKIVRFLCEKPLRSSFVKVYDMFATEEKMYFFMDEYSPTNLGQVIQSGKSTAQNMTKWTRQLAEALTFMHSFAIAHLNIRSENVIFDKDSNVKVIGLARAFLYFNLDQETILKAVKVPKAPYNDHLPPECFEDNFNPQPADIWSFGLLIYEMATRTNPMRTEPAGDAKRKSQSNHFQFQKITNEAQLALVEKMLNPVLLTRPKFEDILKNDYFKTGNETVNSEGSSSKEDLS